MLRMNLLILSLLLMSGTVSSQVGSDPRLNKPNSPDLLAHNERATAARDRGKALVAKGMLREAVEAFREAVRIEDEVEKKYGGFTSTSSYELAKTYTQLGQIDSALAAYKRAFRWDAKRQEIETNGPPFITLTMDYAILLARSGKHEEAKAVYYSGLRKLVQVRRGLEPMPSLVVFEAEPGMTAWDYSPEKLTAAATMAMAADLGSRETAAAEEARQLEPSWVAPVLFLATRVGGSKGSALLKLAESMARTAEEKEWVQDFMALEAIHDPAERQIKTAEVDRNHAEVGVARRKASTVLRKSKDDLAGTYQRIASVSEKRNSGGGLP